MYGGIEEDGKWQARWEKLVFMPTQRYDVPSGKSGSIFVGILSMELDGLRSSKWNSERTIVFQSVMLQCAQCVNNSKHICARIKFRLDFWNCWIFDKLMKDTYNAATGYLGRVRVIETRDQRH